MEKHLISKKLQEELCYKSSEYLMSEITDLKEYLNGGTLRESDFNDAWDRLLALVVAAHRRSCIVAE